MQTFLPARHGRPGCALSRRSCEPLPRVRGWLERTTPAATSEFRHIVLADRPGGARYYATPTRCPRDHSGNSRCNRQAAGRAHRGPAWTVYTDSWTGASPASLRCRRRLSSTRCPPRCRTTGRLLHPRAGRRYARQLWASTRPSRPTRCTGSGSSRSRASRASCGKSQVVGTRDVTESDAPPARRRP